ARGDRLAWFDRAGRELERLDSLEPAATNSFSLSPRGDRVALGRGSRGGIWFLDAARRVLSSSGRYGNFPLWSPDGTHLAYSAARTTSYLDLFLAAVSGDSAEEPLLVTPVSKQLSDWSLDGRFLAFRISDPQTGYDVWAMPLDGDRKAIPIARTPADERDG